MSGHLAGFVKDEHYGDGEFGVEAIRAGQREQSDDNDGQGDASFFLQRHSATVPAGNPAESLALECQVSLHGHRCI
jgi:hypothetical protein